MEKTQHIAILAAGEFPTHPVPLQALREAGFVVCCDSAYLEMERSGLAAGRFIVVGDGDSLSDTDKRRLGDRWLPVAEQDFNDLHKAVAWAMQHFPQPATRLSILGATGRREDHTLGNISYLATFAEEYPGADIEMLTNHGRFVHLHGERTFSSFPGQQVSIVTLTPRLPLYGSGLRWPLAGFLARRWWQATLNEALGHSFTLRTDGDALVFQTYEPKT